MRKSRLMFEWFGVDGGQGFFRAANIIKSLPIFSFFCLWFISASASQASTLSVGLGYQYGGFLGAKYIHELDAGRVYLGGGLLAYSTDMGDRWGYALGYELPLFSPSHYVGVFAGKVAASRLGDYLGGGLTYAYYFGDPQGASWSLGASFAYGKRDLPDRVAGMGFEESKSTGLIHLGYQF